ncbi:ABC transporter ATP-binding protein [archaeon]|nr:MAG: ABC transporter ATP-binding protein [archaeon]
MPEIQLRGVWKRYENILALRDINLKIEDGDYVCILGPTGSGKTTLLKIIAGLVHPTKGKVYIDGREVTGLPPERRGAVYMHQTYALFPHMTVYENVAYGLRARGLDEETVRERVEEVLRLVNLDGWEDAYPRQLSGGMQQRVALSRVLVTGDKIVLLDEPLGALDARLRLLVRDELKRLKQELDLTVVHVTHDQSEAMAISDRIILLREGSIIQDASPEESYFKPTNVFPASFIGDRNLLEAKVVRVDGEGAWVQFKGGEEVYGKGGPFETGDLAVVSIRCEEVKIIDEKSSIPAIIVDVSFLGSYVKYYLRTEGGTLLESNTSLQEYLCRRYHVGDKVYLKLGEIQLFTYPRRGLMREVEAI